MQPSASMYAKDERRESSGGRALELDRDGVREHAYRLERTAWLTADPRAAKKMISFARSSTKMLLCHAEPRRSWPCLDLRLDLRRRDQAIERHQAKYGQIHRGVCDREASPWLCFLTSVHALLGCDATLLR